uniref:Uncharacterized protein n=1 Tax=Molossus molossus TaxID=27622 RepID=A0A7J8DC89_MOLMO|nr:hypothetical protein HJG59_009398 [Molossus molossus]
MKVIWENPQLEPEVLEDGDVSADHTEQGNSPTTLGLTSMVIYERVNSCLEADFSRSCCVTGVYSKAFPFAPVLAAPGAALQCGRREELVRTSHPTVSVAEVGAGSAMPPAPLPGSPHFTSERRSCPGGG